MGDLRNKARKLEAEARLRDTEDRRSKGWTIFRYDFNRGHTRRNLTLGEAIRHLCRITETKLKFWRCPARGLAVEYYRLPYECFRGMAFSRLPEEVAAKRELVTDAIIHGIADFRGLPNRLFDEECQRIRWLLTAPPSVGAAEWLAQKEKLQQKTQRVLATHEPELRRHVLEEKPDSGRYGCTVRARLEGPDPS